MKLYKLTNNVTINEWYVLADHPTEAEDKLITYFNKHDYGFKRDRKVSKIELIATKTEDERFTTGYFLLT